MVCSLLAGIGAAGDLPLRVAGGGPAFCLRRRGAGAFPYVHADDGEFLRLPGAGILRDVQSFPYPPGGDAAAEGLGRRPGQGGLARPLRPGDADQGRPLRRARVDQAAMHRRRRR